MAAIQSGSVARHFELPGESASGLRHAMMVSAALALNVLLTGCATPGVTKDTGRVMDPPLELILYCLFSPRDPACRSLVR